MVPKLILRQNTTLNQYTIQKTWNGNAVEKQSKINVMNIR